jgi:hypothetical protein
MVLLKNFLFTEVLKYFGKKSEEVALFDPPVGRGKSD